MSAEPVRAICWRPEILTFEAAWTPERPLDDLHLLARFEAPSGRVIRREAYWDGGCVYRVSFAPTEPGEWHWHTSCAEDPTLDGLAGSLEARPYEGELALYRHGFIRVADDGRHLAYADGTPFFWLGDTHWEFAYGERWDESNHPAMSSMFRGMVDRRVEQGFTVYQTNLRTDFHGVERYWVDGDLERLVPNVAFYQQELDRRMAYVANAGLVDALGIAWNDSILSPEGPRAMAATARYIVARYGAYPMVWTLAGEIAGYNPEMRETLIDRWREVAKVFEECDGYGHLQTAHYTNERPFASYYHDEDWFDFTLNQAGHGDFVIAESDYREFFAAHGTKPFIEGESMYELCSSLEVNGPREITPVMLRRVAYTAMQLGAAGYTYGAQGIWDDIWDASQFEADPMSRYLANTFNRNRVTWVDAIDAPGGAQMGVMRRFYEEQDFSHLVPYAGEAGSAVLGRAKPLASVAEDGSRLVAYYSESVRKPLAVAGLAAGTWRLRWFDPRTGAYGEPWEATIEGAWPLPEKPSAEDWLLVAEKA